MKTLITMIMLNRMIKSVIVNNLYDCMISDGNGNVIGSWMLSF